jgi:hypothetical protein
MLLLAVACGSPQQKETGAAAAPIARAPADPIVIEPPLPAIDMRAAQARVSPETTLQAVTFERAGSTTVSGVVEGYKAPAYAVPVAAGQTLTVTFQPSNANLYMNVMDAADASGAAVHRSETDGATATIAAGRDSTYLITPFQPRAMARRNETGAYTMTIARS